MLKRILGSIFAIALLAGAPAFAADLSLDGFLRGQCATATASAGAATLNNKCGVITSEALNVVSGSPYTLTLTNSAVAAADIVLWAVENGTNTGGNPYVGRATAAAGSVVFRVGNSTESSPGALFGTIKVKYFVIKP